MKSTDLSKSFKISNQSVKEFTLLFESMGLVKVGKKTTTRKLDSSLIVAEISKILMRMKRSKIQEKKLRNRMRVMLLKPVSNLRKHSLWQ